MSEDGLKDKYRDAVIEILAKNPRVERAVLFGSRAMGTFTTTSDVDIALFGDELTLDDQAKLSGEIENIPMAQKVDLLIYHQIDNPKLCDHIEEYGVEWYRRGSKNKVSEWKRMELKEAIEVNPSCKLEKGKESVYVAMKHVKPWERKIHEKKRRPFPGSGSVFQNGDVLFARITPCLENGKTAYVDFLENSEIAHGSTEFLVLRAKPEVTDTLYVYYLARSPELRNFAIKRMTGSSGRQRVPADALKRFEFNLPPLREQKAIADILGTLDDKIELNRRMGRTLEAMARAIFQSWFVDFDPVVFNAVQARNAIPERFEETAELYRENPEIQGLPEDILDLFPDRFEESELGEIPKGWEIGPLSDIARLITKTIQPKKKPYILWEHYSIPAFDESCRPKMEYGNKIKSGKYLVPKDAVLASKLNPRFPRIWLPDIKHSNVAVCSTEFMPFCAVQETWRPFLYELLKSDVVQERIRGYVSGSTGSRQRVRPKDIAMMPILIPDFSLVEKFCELISGLHNQLLINRDGALILTKIRDTLLSKLISGELRVPETEAFLEGAVCEIQL